MTNTETGKQRQHIPLHEQEGDLVDEVEKVIEQVGCADSYYKLETCLGENDRDWRKCQKEVKEFRLCHEKSKEKN